MVPLLKPSLNKSSSFFWNIKFEVYEFFLSRPYCLVLYQRIQASVHIDESNIYQAFLKMKIYSSQY